MSSLGKWLDERAEVRRRREATPEPFRLRPDAAALLDAAGFDGRWRIHRGKAHGRWADGSRVVLGAEEFERRFMVRGAE